MKKKCEVILKNGKICRNYEYKFKNMDRIICTL